MLQPVCQCSELRSAETIPPAVTRCCSPPTELQIVLNSCRRESTQESAFRDSPPPEDSLTTVFLTSCLPVVFSLSCSLLALFLNLAGSRCCSAPRSPCWHLSCSVLNALSCQCIQNFAALIACDSLICLFCSDTGS